jgi:hypothetical protein
MHSSSRGQGFTVVRGARGKQEDVLVLHPDAKFLLVAGKKLPLTHHSYAPMYNSASGRMILK